MKPRITVITLGVDDLERAFGGYFQNLDQHLWEVVWNPAWHSPD